MKIANDLKDNLLHVNRLRKLVGFDTIFSAIKSELKLSMIENFSAKKILVLSPHPDDDIFGCGGTLALFKLAGSEITVLNLTNGKNSHRLDEATRACKEIDVCDIRFWDTLDGQVKATKETVSKLSELLEEIAPEIIFVPSFFDTHNDHIETAKILAKSLAQSDLSPEIFSYEIWQPLFANRLVKIDAIIDKKQKAIETHRSQLEDRDYLSAILGLNQYRAGMFGSGKYAEAFFACNKKLYLKLFSRVSQ